jgi:preprotein translocase subunit SecG
LHPVVIVVVALLVALALVSVFFLHRKARSTLDGHESLATDSDAMLIGSSGSATH